MQYAHVGNNFILDYHEAALADVQPTLIVSTQHQRPVDARRQQSVNIRPVNSVNVNMNYFMPGTMGGDHAFKIGGYWKDATTTLDAYARRIRVGALPDRGQQRLLAARPTGDCQAQRDARRPDRSTTC